MSKILDRAQTFASRVGSWGQEGQHNDDDDDDFRGGAYKSQNKKKDQAPRPGTQGYVAPSASNNSQVQYPSTTGPPSTGTYPNQPPNNMPIQYPSQSRSLPYADQGQSSRQLNPVGGYPPQDQYYGSPPPGPAFSPFQANQNAGQQYYPLQDLRLRPENRTWTEPAYHQGGYQSPPPPVNPTNPFPSLQGPPSLNPTNSFPYTSDPQSQCPRCKFPYVWSTHERVWRCRC